MRVSGLVAQNGSAPLLFRDLSGEIPVLQDEYELKSGLVDESQFAQQHPCWIRRPQSRLRR